MPRRPDRQVFVSVDWLAEHLHDDHLRIFDARYVYPHESPQGEQRYEAGHIPGRKLNSMRICGTSALRKPANWWPREAASSRLQV